MRFVAAVVLAFQLFTSPLPVADDEQDKVDRIFAAYDKPGSPGCAVGVIQSGDFVYRKGYGLGSIELGSPLTSESIFYMGSVSKQFTAASIVLAAEQGYLSLDDDVRKYIPELPDYGQAITLRQMLHHTSGFRDFLVLFQLAGRDVADTHSEAENIDLIARQKQLNYAPGDEYLYSNTNYYLLGVVIHRATKKTLNEFATGNIFKPLGMTHTRFYDDHNLVVPGRVAAYSPGKEGAFNVDWSTQFDTVGAGGLMSTVDDMLLWDRNFYDNKLGKGTLLKELQTKGVLNNGKEISYALGLVIQPYRGLTTVEHDGALYGYRTVIVRFPEQRFTVLALCNISSASTSSLAHKVADVYLEKNFQPLSGSLGTSYRDGPDPSAFAGKYLDPRKQIVYTFTVSDGNLVAWGATLPRLGPNQFADLGHNPISFEEKNGAMNATLTVDGQPFFEGKRIGEVPVTESHLAAYAGSYRSAELDVRYVLSMSGGKLVLENGWQPVSVLTPLTEDEFVSDEYGTFVFRRDAKHRVSGFGLYAGNVRNLRFDKTH